METWVPDQGQVLDRLAALPLPAGRARAAAWRPGGCSRAARGARHSPLAPLALGPCWLPPQAAAPPPRTLARPRPATPRALAHRPPPPACSLAASPSPAAVARALAPSPHRRLSRELGGGPEDRAARTARRRLSWDPGAGRRTGGSQEGGLCP